jgi:hypothetical protein
MNTYFGILKITHMKKLLIPACMLCIAFYGCDSGKKTDATVSTSDSGTITAAKTEEPAPAPMPDSATMMKNWQEFMTPGEQHKLLASWDGTWTGDITMWMSPGAPPQVSKATAVNSMLYGGRYQLSKHSGNMMGMPFEGESIMGYDNNKKQFVSSWLDNMGTGIITMEGPWDESSKTLTLSGKCMDPMTKRETWMRQTMKVIDKNNQFIEMYGPGPDGKEYKMMEIKMKRK